MTRDEMFCEDVRWVRAINALRNKHVAEVKLAKYDLQRIHELQQEVLSRQFVWEVPHICKIPKKTGGFRECLALPLKSRIVMSVIASVYYDTCSFMYSFNCVSYQQCVSVPGIVRDVQHSLQGENVIGYKVDLSKYFDSVPKDNLMGLLATLSDGCIIDEYVSMFYNDTRLLTKDGIVEHYRSLCQGCALSPILANLYLRKVDAVVGDMCKYWRYSDDILLVGERASEAMSVLTEMLADIGLTLNPKKICSLNDEFEFLGARIGNSICISKDNLSAIKREVKHRCKGRPKSRAGQKRAIKSLQHYFFKEDWNGYSMFGYYANLVSGYSDFVEIDRYCRMCIRAVLTGKNNFTTNLHKTTDDDLQELGWVNIVDMLNYYKKDREHYIEIAHQIGGNYEFL